MVAFEPQSQAQSAKAVIPYQNVYGWERAASIGGGLLLVVKGLRRGGLFGLINVGLGGMGLLRGLSGHCEAKRVLERAFNTPVRQQDRLRTDSTPIPNWDMEAGPPAGADLGPDSRDPMTPHPNPIG